MRACAVVTCKRQGVHTFPTHDIQRRQWIKATRIDVQRKIGWHLRKFSCICSDHFTPSDFETHGKRLTLKKTAVPSVFPWTATMPSTSSTNTVEPRDFTQDFLETSFNPFNASKNYSITEPKIAFVEEHLSLNIELTGAEHDPLKINESDVNAQHVLVTPVQVPDVSGEEVIVDINENQDEQQCATSTQIIQIETVDNFTQTLNTEPEIGINPFSIYKYKHSDKAIHYYTGLESFQNLMYVFYTLGNCSNLKYFYESPPKKLSSLEKFFIILIILRRHKPFQEISMLYLISIKQVTNIFITWIRFMALQWKNLDLWLDREEVTSYMPLDFYDKYPMTRVILDATECPIKKPGLPLAQQITFSTYKNRNTIKFLVGIAPSGLITYVSPSYGGSATDRQIIERSAILHRFDYNDEIMVDKGLNIQDIFIPYGVKVNMPTFFKKGNQINPDTLIRDRKVASKRVHVERIIGMLKTFKILKEPMNHTETILSSDIAYICAMLVNFRSCIINKWS